jgi:hypothetical protein
LSKASASPGCGTAPFSGPGGLRNLAFDNDKDRRRRSESSPARESPAPAPRPGKKPSSPGVGNALREAYQEALREDIPPEMLDLLGKLG